VVQPAPQYLLATRTDSEVVGSQVKDLILLISQTQRMRGKGECPAAAQHSNGKAGVSGFDGSQPCDMKIGQVHTASKNRLSREERNVAVMEGAMHES
jgi:hypothetical protein